MLGRRPMFGTIVQKVKFSKPDRSWLRRHAVTELASAALPLIIPPMPNVRVVELHHRYDELELEIAVAYMDLFPSMQKLCLVELCFPSLISLARFLSACGSLKVLSFQQTMVDDWSEDDSDDIAVYLKLCSSNLTELEELSVTSNYFIEREDPLTLLVEHFPQAKLKSLSFESLHSDDPCSMPAMERLFRLIAPSLVNLVVHPTFRQISENQIWEMFGRLPALQTLHSLTIGLEPNHPAKSLIQTLAAPNLSTIIFRIGFSGDGVDEHRKHLDETLRVAVPWATSESLKSFLKCKFPLLRRIGFHLFVARDSDLHFRRGLRRRMERRLTEYLDQMGADVTEYLELQWLNGNCKPVTYSHTNGKPPWTIEHSSWNKEPKTEASDCETDKSDEDSEYDLDGYRRTWTAEDERYYRLYGS
ncbi:hypothetical protein FB451DRAFT_296833 [Mycena latifolia]|nr:hypothetical protein FB451DRAFT_296833 [Mycena latifolia]